MDDGVDANGIEAHELVNNVDHARDEDVILQVTDAGNGAAPTDDNLERRRQLRDTMFFSAAPDRRIDYILVYGKDSASDQTRLDFEDGLRASGIELEYEDIAASSDGNAYFVKVHCPWDVLTKGAALMKLRKRIKLGQDIGEDLTEEGGDCCELSCFQPSPDVVPPEMSEDYFTAVFNTERIEIFDMPSKETFFTNAERSLIAKFMLDTTRYCTLEGKAKQKEDIHVGVESLIRRKVYSAAFPLHERSLVEDDEDPKYPHRFEGPDTDRQRLYEAWANPKKAFIWQPLDLIRKYFGEKIAIYFAWLGLYTTMLVPASIFGIAAFLYGLITMPSSVRVKEICDATGPQFIMCPECDRLCDYGHLSDSCHFARLTHIFDNYATIAVAVFMSAWALCFMEIWNRRQAEIQYDWDVADFELEETVRPEFDIKIKTTRTNPITKKEEHYLTGCSYFVRRCTSVSVILFMTIVVLGLLFAVIVYRLAIVTALYGLPNITAKTNARLITSVTAALINLVVILILSKIYEWIALMLTNLEAHRTCTQYEDSVTFKMIIFQFINFYGSVVYIAFFKGSFVGRPGNRDTYVFGRYREDQCDPSGCIVDLTIQLAIILIGKQIVNNVKQIIIPVLCKCFRSRDVKNKDIYMRWEQDNDLQQLGPLGLFQEYLSMVIQFGFVTIFVAAFPLAPLCALINNVVELRLDAYKLIKFYQRSPAARAQDIGAWHNILHVLSFVAVVSNAFIIGWTSDLVPKILYEFESENNTLTGYVNASLSVFNTTELPEDMRPDKDLFNSTYPYCRYNGYRYGPESEMKYEYTSHHWLQLCARFAFIIVFEHVCIILINLVMALIPDVSARVKRLRVYERELARKMAFDEKFGESRRRQEEFRRSRIASMHVDESPKGNERLLTTYNDDDGQ